MKFLAVFAALVAVAASHNTWTLPQLSDAIQNPNTDPALLPYLEQALNEMMDALVAGKPIVPVGVVVPAVDLSGWTLTELSDAMQNPQTDPALLPYLEQALNAMMDAIVAGTPVAAGGVTIPAMEITSWTLSELSDALQNPITKPELIPYLEHALNQMMEAIVSGNQMDVIAVPIPAGLVPVSPVIVPTPVDDVAFPVEEVPSPITPVVTSTSPLVQIIVNVKQQA